MSNVRLAFELHISGTHTHRVCIETHEIQFVICIYSIVAAAMDDFTSKNHTLTFHIKVHSNDEHNIVIKIHRAELFIGNTHFDFPGTKLKLSLDFHRFENYNFNYSMHVD